MSERRALQDATPEGTVDDVTSPADAVSGLAPSIRSLATASLPSRERSLPAALCTVAGEIGLEAADRQPPDTDRIDHVLEPPSNAIVLLEGYVRLRFALAATADDAGNHGETALAIDPQPSWLPDLLEDLQLPADRDAAILASDHLHASADAVIADTPIPDRRHLELYRLLTAGSTAIAHRFLTHADAKRDDGKRPSDACAGVEAKLAATASAVGAAAVDAPTETRRALETYSHAMMAALASQATTDADDDPRSRVARLLAGEVPQRTIGNDTGGEPAVDRHLERARNALETIAGTIDADATDASIDDDSTPLERLERATHIPFQK